MKITSDLFAAFLKCPTKCYLRSTGQTGLGNAYADWVREQDDAYRKESAHRLLAAAECRSSVTAPNTSDLKSATWTLALDLTVNAGDMESQLHAVERIPAHGRDQHASFVPIRFTTFNKLTKDDRLLMAFDALVVSEAVGREVSGGKIIHGDDNATFKVKVDSLFGTVRALIGKMSAILAAGSPPDLILNRHCGECEFRDGCRQKALEKDDLSLLSNITEKERRKFHSKGIFTVTQLSYTFRPRRRPKRLRNKREKYHHALKALAIRQQKICIVGNSELKIEGTPVFLDVEGLPDRDFYYLIGVRFTIGDGVVQHNFWAEDFEDEKRIWGDFLAALSKIEKPVLIHYGSFETTFLRRMSERYGEPVEASPAAKAIKSAINLLSFIFAQIYFPTYSNGLKDVGRWFGWKWTGTNPSGLQSIISRMNWQQSGDTVAKQNLTAYNSEDCEALQVLADTLVRLCSPDTRSKLEQGTEPAAVLAESSSPNGRLLRRFTTPIEDFKAINEAARWDFQRDRVYIRTDKTLKRAAAKKQTRLTIDKSRRKQILPVNKKVICQPLMACPFCGNKPDKEHRPRKLLLYDLRFSKSGVKRWIVQYRFCYYWCNSCQKRFGRPEGFWPKSEFGRNLVAFVIYQTIDLCLPQMTTARSIRRLFGLRIGDSTVSDLKSSAARYYAETRLSILATMIKANVIHVDDWRVKRSRGEKRFRASVSV